MISFFDTLPIGRKRWRWLVYLLAFTVFSSSALLPPLCFSIVVAEAILLLLDPASARRVAQALPALSIFMIPTTSRWPILSRSMVTRAQVSPTKTIWLSFDALVRSIASGDIEIRDPARDLPKLFDSGLLVDGWRIHLHVSYVHRLQSLLLLKLARLRWSYQVAICALIPCVEVHTHLQMLKSLKPSISTLSLQKPWEALSASS
ncbi:hypothetical protein BC834DRAFT_887053 [Gloeopeniophorella convolvens]|nr:hypothetical protein BC834DRAFT_887053 [Gloeopeniophorella convolvens]